ncbi:MAG: potassium-transporting ATPase subunit KdpB, partial [Candidatus Margulisiibacteriota bacterium]
MRSNKKSIWKKEIIFGALKSSFLKLSPLVMLKNPVMFIVEISAFITSVITIYNIYSGLPWSFNLQLSIWLWFTVIFANFAESLAEGKGKAQAQALKQNQSNIFANVFRSNSNTESIPASSLKKGDTVLVTDNEFIPCDGEIIDGVGLVDESAMTGESAPVVRESGGDRSGVTGGTKLLSGKLKIRVTANPGETFLDQMIKMIESAKRQKTPNEVALEILLIGLTILFFVVVVTLKFFAGFMLVSISLPILIALLVCLMPTTIGGLLPAIGIAGMDKLLVHNVIALSGRAVEAAGDVNIVLLDKTGTITLGNRLATEFIPANGISEEELEKAALLSSLADDTPEGRSIVVLAKEKLKLRGSDIKAPENTKFIQFTAETRMSGVDFGSTKIRKGAIDAIEAVVKESGQEFPVEVKQAVQKIAGQGGTPLIVVE